MLAELDSLLATRVGDTLRTGMLGEVARGVYDLQPITARDVRDANAAILPG